MSNEKKTKKPSRLSKNTLKTAKRLLKYVTETYKFRFGICVHFNQLRCFYFCVLVTEIYAR